MTQGLLTSPLRSNEKIGAKLTNPYVLHCSNKFEVVEDVDNWESTLSFLGKNREFMSSTILQKALQDCSSVHVIKEMLRINPAAANIPKFGKSALQIAVMYNAPIDIVYELIKACPYALYEGNGYYDPLKYVKIWRKDEKKLVRMLEKPLSYWQNLNSDSTMLSDSVDEALPQNGVGNRNRRDMPNMKNIMTATIRALVSQLERGSKQQKSIITQLKSMEQRDKYERIKIRRESEELANYFENQMSQFCTVITESILGVTHKQNMLLKLMQTMESKFPISTSSHLQSTVVGNYFDQVSTHVIDSSPNYYPQQRALFLVDSDQNPLVGHKYQQQKYQTVCSGIFCFKRFRRI